MTQILHAVSRGVSQTSRPILAKWRQGGRPRWRRGVRPAFAAALMALLTTLAACSTTSGGSGRQVTALRVDAGRTARLISAYRAQNGLGPVSVDSRLMQVATAYARVMGERDRIEHGLGGKLPRRIEAAGYDWGYAAENLAASFSSLDDAMQGWKASPGHRKNLLSPYATEIGIAAVSVSPVGEHRNYWALVLATPRPERGMTLGSVR